jgi:phage gp16-like protein
MGKKALALDDETYRGMMTRLTGHDSAADLDEAGRDRVIRYLKSQGFAPPAGPKRAGSAIKKAIAAMKSGGASPQEAMILGLWEELRRIGAFRHGIHARLDSWMHRQGVHVSHPRFLSPHEAGPLIEALKKWLAREKRRRGIE